MKRLMKPALAIAVAAMLATTLAMPFKTQAAASAPEDAVKAFVKAVNDGNAAAAAAAYTPDGTFTDLQPDGAFGLVGAAALQAGFGELTPRTDGVKVTEMTTNGSVVLGKARIHDGDSEAAGVSRYLQTFRAVTRDGKIASFDVTYDTNDSETTAYLAYLKAADEADQDDGPPPDALEFAMGPGRDGAQTGSAIFAGEEGVTFVAIEITPGPDGVPQPAQLVAGDCPGVGAIVSQLAPPLSGNSFSIISMDVSELEAGNFAVRVAGSAINPNRLVSCGETESATPFADEEPSAPVAPAAPTTPPPPTGAIIAPATGTGPAGNDRPEAWLPLSVAIAGVALAAAGAGLGVDRRRR